MKTKAFRELFLAAYTLFMGLSACYILLFSVLAFHRYPLLFPKGFTLAYWVQGLWQSSLFHEALIASCGLGILNGVFSCCVGFLTARSLARCRWLSRQTMTVLYSLPLMLPGMVLFLGVHQIVLRTGLINSWTSVVLAHSLVTIPYTTTLFLGFFKGISPELEVAAQTLGATPSMIFFRILLPLLRPVIYLALAVSFLISFSEYFSTALIGGGRVITVSGILYPLISNGEISRASVVSVVFLAVNGVVLLLADRMAGKSADNRYLYE